MWGVAIAYIIMGAGQYRYRAKLRLPPHPDVEIMGRTFWRIGWAMLIWWLAATAISMPERYKIIIALFGTLWLCVRCLQLLKRIAKSP